MNRKALRRLDGVVLGNTVPDTAVRSGAHSWAECAWMGTQTVYTPDWHRPE